MRWREAVWCGPARLAGHVLDLLYPPRCVLCDAEPLAATASASPGPSDRGARCRAAPVCPTCADRLADHRPRCLACGAPVCGPREDGCVRCRRGHGSELDGIVVFGAYEGDLRELVLRAKRPAGRLVAGGLARLLVERRGDILAGWRIDLVAAVPMHWWRRSLRGMSAADELARGVAAGLAVPRAAAALRRHRATRMQNELPWEARGDNVRDAFCARRLVAGRRVLLVDDVTTTGATLAACSRAASAAGAAAVYAAVVARADREGEW